jgi:hypothetical protein
VNGSQQPSAAPRGCPHTGPRSPVPIPVRCWGGCGASVIVAPGTMCATCGGDFRKDSGWRVGDPPNPAETAAWEAHFSNGDHERELERKVSSALADEERAARERERAEAARLEADAEDRRRAEEAEAAERAREAEEKRRQEDATRRGLQEAEERRLRLDRALLAGEDPRSVMYSLGGVTEAQVRARQVYLAKLRGNRGRPWAEAALDHEIVRLRRQAGLTRDAVKRELNVGAGRIARVEREAGIGSERDEGGSGASP